MLILLQYVKIQKVNIQVLNIQLYQVLYKVLNLLLNMHHYVYVNMHFFMQNNINEKK